MGGGDAKMGTTLTAVAITSDASAVVVAAATRASHFPRWALRTAHQ